MPVSRLHQLYGQPSQQSTDVRTSSPRCACKGCSNKGEFPAPKYRTMPESFAANVTLNTALFEGGGRGERIWLCKEHVRDYNKQWNFFDGMNQQEIDAFHKDAVTGHRVSFEHASCINGKRTEAYSKAWNLREGYDVDAIKESAEAASLPKEVKQALRLLGLNYPVKPDVIKQRYRALVKECHPDHNGKEGEEKLKLVNQAYSVLRKTLLA